MAFSASSSRRAIGILLLVIASLAATSSTSHAFVTPSGATLSSTSKSTTTTTARNAEALGGDVSSADFTVRVVEGGENDSKVVDVAAYRNNLINPQMMVDRAQKKRDSIDTTKAAFDGIKVGLLYVGPVIGIGTYFSTPGDGALSSALSNYGELEMLLGNMMYEV